MAGTNKKKNEDGNSTVEWISDNLRYFELIAIVVVLIVVVFFVFRAVAGNGFFGSGTKNAGGEAVAAASSAEDIVEQTAAETTPAAVSASSATEIVTASASSASSAASSTSEEETAASSEEKPAEEVPEVEAPAIPEGASMDYSDGDVLTAAENYLNGLVESGASEGVESYNWINTYSYPGYADGEVVALACYHYKYTDFEDYIPGLTALYLVPGEDGTLTATEDLSPEQMAYLQSVAETAEVKDLIANIGAQYQSVIDSNPELAAYVNGGE